MSGIVLEPRRLVYWPVPKCASTSIKTAIAKLLGLTYVNVHDAPFTWTPDPIPGYDNFAVIRHPGARLYSLWENKVAPGHPVPANLEAGLDWAVFGRVLGLVRSGMPFESFVRTVTELPPGEADPHWAPQSSSVPWVATWVRLEDADPLLRLVLPVLNVSVRGTDWVAVHSKTTWRRIRDYYAVDFARFGYAS